MYPCSVIEVKGIVSQLAVYCILILLLIRLLLGQSYARLLTQPAALHRTGTSFNLNTALGDVQANLQALFMFRQIGTSM